MRRGFIASDTSANSPSMRGSASARSHATTICGSLARNCLARSSSARARSSSAREFALALRVRSDRADRQHRRSSATMTISAASSDRRQFGVEHVEPRRARAGPPMTTTATAAASPVAPAAVRKRPNAAFEIAKPRAPCKRRQRPARRPLRRRSDARFRQGANQTVSRLTQCQTESR